jgi:methyltransferase-like protein
LINNWIIMAGLKTILSHSKSIVTTKTGNEYVLVPVANNIADMNSVYTLNETGAFIWEHINGENSVEDIINEMMEEYEVDFITASEDVYSFIDDMSKYLIIREE